MALVTTGRAAIDLLGQRDAVDPCGLESIARPREAPARQRPPRGRQAGLRRAAVAAPLRVRAVAL